jgi:hypothetical protein
MGNRHVSTSAYSAMPRTRPSAQQWSSFPAAGQPPAATSGTHHEPPASDQGEQPAGAIGGQEQEQQTRHMMVELPQGRGQSIDHMWSQLRRQLDMSGKADRALRRVQAQQQWGQERQAPGAQQQALLQELDRLVTRGAVKLQSRLGKQQEQGQQQQQQEQQQQLLGPAPGTAAAERPAAWSAEGAQPLPFSLVQWVAQRRQMLQALSSQRLHALCLERGVPVTKEAPAPEAASSGADEGPGSGGAGGAQDAGAAGCNTSGKVHARPNGKRVGRGGGGERDGGWAWASASGQAAGRQQGKPNLKRRSGAGPSRPQLVLRLLAHDTAAIAAACGAALGQAELGALLEPHQAHLDKRRLRDEAAADEQAASS